MEATLVLPNQLFKSHPAIKKGRPVWIAEEFLFFKIQPFHRQRLILLRLAMKEYEAFLKKQGHEVHYIESTELDKRGDLFKFLAKMNIKNLYLAEEPDSWFNMDLQKSAKKYGWKLHIDPSPMFLCTTEELSLFFKEKSHYSMASFYAYQRKKLDILMKDGKPEGGKFSFDIENRKKIPKTLSLPKYHIPKQTKKVKEAIAYVESNFPNAIGNKEPFLYAATFAEAENTLSDFIENKLSCFGAYEDAMLKNESFLFHSVLTPSLNIGLITPEQIIDQVITAWKKRKIPLNSVEGFVRQVIGWREFIRACYLLKGNAQRTRNGLGHKKPIPKGFWDATTGIEPIDAIIRKILDTGYCHHIERLMVLGNFLLLTETSPDAVYDWFMQYFVDAYDWVMVPNVYGMSQYADGGLITSKPYISGSNYLLKMSDYKKGPWSDLWDGLFWRFLKKHKNLISNNPRMKMLLAFLKKNETEINKKITKAEKAF
ncbi:MAG: cryptochrome/photolyase family protein [Chlamydiales bacterium]|nr:cryptochrome/photolyase family protein [Chlamydiales bacterium]